MLNQILLSLRCKSPQGKLYKMLLGIFVFMLVSGFAPLAAQAQAIQPDPTVCYAIADNQGKLPGGGSANNQDELVQMNRMTAATTAIGATGTTNIEAMTFVMVGGTTSLYAADGGKIGKIDLATGVFTAIGDAGSGVGSAGTIKFNDLDSLAYDMPANVIYAAHRVDATNDVLLKINPTTGAHIPDAFGPGKDYLVVPAPLSEPSYKNVDDLSFDPTTGKLYATINDSGTGGLLAIIDKDTAALTEIATYADLGTPGNWVDDIEGISFFNDGTLYASTGNNGPDNKDTNKLWQIDKQTGNATLIGPFPNTFVDYEALGCLTQTASIALIKYTNGQDADTPPGPTIQVGSPVVWTYVVTNTGSVDLTNLVLTDDKLGTLTCNEGAVPNLSPGQSFTCTVNGIASTVGQYANIGTVTGNWSNSNGSFVVTDTNPSHYFGAQPAITLQKTVYAGHNAGASCPGSELVTGALGDAVTYCFVVTNTGNTALNGITLDDVTLGITRANLIQQSGTEPLAPNASLVFYYEATLSQDLVNTANTVGTPSDANGTAIPGLTNVTAQDTAQVTLTPIALPGSIGDTIFIDANGNNTFDAGEGIPGITVVLTLPGNLTQTTTTTGDGHYLFTNLPSGAYVVTVQTSGTVLNGLTNHVDPDGGNNSTSSLTLAPGENNLLQDFGYLPAQQSPLGAIGDFVWQDTNGNGIQENGEPGLPNIAVTLFDSNNNVVKTITTDATGHYLFSNLPAGNYTVGFALPSAGFFFSPPNQGNNDAVDSDAGQNGQTGTISLAAGQTDLTVDAGIFAPPNLVVKKFAIQNGAAVQPGDTIIYSFAYTNTGKADATGVTLKEIVPQFTTFDATNSSTGWDCAGGSIAAGTICTFTIGNLPANSSVASTIKFAVKLDLLLPAEAKAVINQVTIADDGQHGTPPGGQTNTSTVTTEIVNPTNLDDAPEPTLNRAIFLPLIQNGR